MTARMLKSRSVYCWGECGSKSNRIFIVSVETGVNAVASSAANIIDHLPAIFIFFMVASSAAGIASP